jgi:uncharacterized protein DUF6766
MRRFLRDNGLTIAFGLLFVASLVGQAIAGLHAFNEEQRSQDGAEISFGRYLTSSRFASAVTENWQSEYLQFTLFILLTVWLIQRGSPESKEPGKEGTESERDQRIGRHADEDSPRWAKARGVSGFLYSNSLLLLMGTFWLASWFAQSVTSMTDYNATKLENHEDTVSWLGYVGSADFWEKTLQNWQSEFLAVGSMAIFAVYLRQRGSPESKPVGAAHHETGVEG